jgi:hypothetical protein
MLSAEGWTLKGDINFNITQNAYSDSWAGTEKGSITWVAGSSLSAEKALSPLFYNINTLKLAFGQTHQQQTDAAGNNFWVKPMKSTDKIDAESLLKMTMKTWVNPFASVRMESQFIDLSDPTLTRMVNPMKFTESAGITRNFIEKGNELLTSRFGLAFRENLDRDVLKTDGSGDRENITTVDGGLEFITEYKNVFTPSNIGFSSKLQVYQAFFNSREDEYLHEEWKSPDMNWENTVNVKLYKALTLNFYLQLIYEKEQIAELQLKETMGLGFSYNLF